jgi:transcriptional regulator with XRE-family HTH domain
MAVYVVGDFLRETRLRKGYTQEEVSYGICTPASLSRIENGAQKPGRLILEKLFERLGTENNLFNSFVSREEMELYIAIQTLIRNVTDGDLHRIEEQIDIVEKLTQNTSELERQSLFWAKGELATQKYGNDCEAMDCFMKAVQITLPDFDGKNPLRNHLLTFDEITIINSIAVRHGENGDLLTAIQLDMWLKEYMENKIIDGRMKTAKYPMILYNLSYWLGEENCHNEALKMAEQGVDFCVKYGNLPAFPILMFNQGAALAELERYDEAKKCFLQSITIFEAMKKPSQVQTAIDWCREHYKIEF